MVIYLYSKYSNVVALTQKTLAFIPTLISARQTHTLEPNKYYLNIFLTLIFVIYYGRGCLKDILKRLNLLACM